jgi:hypothetical protein
LALVSYNILATVRAVLASVHGVGKIDAGLSDYYMVDEIQSTYRGMMIAVPPENWSVFAECERQQLAEILLDLAARVHLKKFLKRNLPPAGVVPGAVFFVQSRF